MSKLWLPANVIKDYKNPHPFFKDNVEYGGLTERVTPTDVEVVNDTLQRQDDKREQIKQDKLYKDTVNCHKNRGYKGKKVKMTPKIPAFPGQSIEVELNNRLSLKRWTVTANGSSYTVFYSEKKGVAYQIG